MPRTFLRGGRFIFLTLTGYSEKVESAGVGYPSDDTFLVTGNYVHGGLLPVAVSNADLLLRFDASSNGRLTFGARHPINSALVHDWVYWDSGYYLRVLSGLNTSYGLYRATTLLGSYSLTGSGVARLRFQLSGTVLRAKAWIEPANEPLWQIEVTDATYNSGYISIGIPAPTTLYWLGIGTGGSEPPASGNLMSITGRVTRGGSPVVGAKVIAVLHGLDTSLPLIPGIHVVEATTDSNGNYTLYFDTDNPGPWLICAMAVINGVYFSTEGRLVYFG